MMLFRIMTIGFALAVIAAMLMGCATAQPPRKVQKVYVKADNYCKIAKKIKWSVLDTAATIDQVRRHNKTRDKVC